MYKCYSYFIETERPVCQRTNTELGRPANAAYLRTILSALGARKDYSMHGDGYEHSRPCDKGPYF